VKDLLRLMGRTK